MKGKILVTYKSITGFTREYAEMIAHELDAVLMDFKQAAVQTMLDFDIVIFGGRMHAGTVDGLKQAKELFHQSKASHFIVFATGACPNEGREIIEEMWRRNLSDSEQKKIPHFYMQSGLRYEKMPFSDKMMMKVFCFMLKRKKTKDPADAQMMQAISGSYDVSSRTYITPLLTCVRNLVENPPTQKNA